MKPEIQGNIDLNFSPFLLSGNYYKYYKIKFDKIVQFQMELSNYLATTYKTFKKHSKNKDVVETGDRAYKLRFFHLFTRHGT